MSNVRPEGEWESYSYHGPEGLVRVSYCKRATEFDEESYPGCARVIVPFQDLAAESAYRLEDELVELLASSNTDCLMIGTLTYGETRELVFQVRDWEQFRRPVGGWMVRHADIDLDVSEHDGWQFFYECVWPSAATQLWIADRNTVDSLVRNGSDPKKEHSLEYVFIGEQKRLEEIRAALLNRGYLPYEASVAPDQLVMVKRSALDLQAIYEESLQNKKAAEGAGVTCDGWGASIVR